MGETLHANFPDLRPLCFRGGSPQTSIQCSLGAELLRAPQRFYALRTLTEQWNFFTNGSGDLGIGGTGLRNMKQWVRGSWNPGDRTFGGNMEMDWDQKTGT